MVCWLLLAVFKSFPRFLQLCLPGWSWECLQPQTKALPAALGLWCSLLSSSFPFLWTALQSHLFHPQQLLNVSFPFTNLWWSLSSSWTFLLLSSQVTPNLFHLSPLKQLASPLEYFLYQDKRKKKKKKMSDFCQIFLLHHFAICILEYLPLSALNSCSTAGLVLSGCVSIFPQICRDWEAQPSPVLVTPGCSCWWICGDPQPGVQHIQSRWLLLDFSMPWVGSVCLETSPPPAWASFPCFLQKL